MLSTTSAATSIFSAATALAKARLGVEATYTGVAAAAAVKERRCERAPPPAAAFEVISEQADEHDDGEDEGGGFEYLVSFYQMEQEAMAALLLRLLAHDDRLAQTLLRDSRLLSELLRRLASPLLLLPYQLRCSNRSTGHNDQQRCSKSDGGDGVGDDDDDHGYARKDSSTLVVSRGVTSAYCALTVMVLALLVSTAPLSDMAIDNVVPVLLQAAKSGVVDRERLTFDLHKSLCNHYHCQGHHKSGRVMDAELDVISCIEAIEFDAEGLLEYLMMQAQDHVNDGKSAERRNGSDRNGTESLEGSTQSSRSALAEGKGTVGKNEDERTDEPITRTAKKGDKAGWSKGAPFINSYGLQRLGVCGLAFALAAALKAPGPSTLTRYLATGAVDVLAMHASCRFFTLTQEKSKENRSSERVSDGKGDDDGSDGGSGSGGSGDTNGGGCGGAPLERFIRPYHEWQQMTVDNRAAVTSQQQEESQQREEGWKEQVVDVRAEQREEVHHNSSLVKEVKSVSKEIKKVAKEAANRPRPAKNNGESAGGDGVKATVTASEKGGAGGGGGGEKSPSSTKRVDKVRLPAAKEPRYLDDDVIALVNGDGSVVSSSSDDTNSPRPGSSRLSPPRLRPPPPRLRLSSLSSPLLCALCAGVWCNGKADECITKKERPDSTDDGGGSGGGGSGGGDSCGGGGGGSVGPCSRVGMNKDDYGIKGGSAASVVGIKGSFRRGAAAAGNLKSSKNSGGGGGGGGGNGTAASGVAGDDAILLPSSSPARQTPMDTEAGDDSRSDVMLLSFAALALNDVPYLKLQQRRFKLTSSQSEQQQLRSALPSSNSGVNGGGGVAQGEAKGEADGILRVRSSCVGSCCSQCSWMTLGDPFQNIVIFLNGADSPVRMTYNYREGSADKHHHYHYLQQNQHRQARTLCMALEQSRLCHTSSSADSSYCGSCDVMRGMQLRALDGLLEARRRVVEKDEQQEQMKRKDMADARKIKRNGSLNLRKRLAAAGQEARLLEADIGGGTSTSTSTSASTFTLKSVLAGGSSQQPPHAARLNETCKGNMANRSGGGDRVTKPIGDKKSALGDLTSPKRRVDATAGNPKYNNGGSGSTSSRSGMTYDSEDTTDLMSSSSSSSHEHHNLLLHLLPPAHERQQQRRQQQQELQAAGTIRHGHQAILSSIMDDGIDPSSYIIQRKMTFDKLNGVFLSHNDDDEGLKAREANEGGGGGDKRSAKGAAADDDCNVSSGSDGQEEENDIFDEKETRWSGRESDGGGGGKVVDELERQKVLRTQNRHRNTIMAQEQEKRHIQEMLRLDRVRIDRMLMEEQQAKQKCEEKTREVTRLMVCKQLVKEQQRAAEDEEGKRRARIRELETLRIRKVKEEKRRQAKQEEKRQRKLNEDEVEKVFAYRQQRQREEEWRRQEMQRARAGKTEKERRRREAKQREEQQKQEALEIKRKAFREEERAALDLLSAGTFQYIKGKMEFRSAAFA